jgi:hypothetical protein
MTLRINARERVALWKLAKAEKVKPSELARQILHNGILQRVLATEKRT